MDYILAFSTSKKYTKQHIKMNKSFIWFLVLLGLMFSSCKTSQKLSKIEVSKTRFVAPELKSTLNVHYKIDKQAIRDTFNTLIDMYLNQDMELQAMGMDIVVQKRDEASVEFSGKKVLTTLPLDISLAKETLLSNINAKGSLRLDFMTDLDMDTSWVIKTNTTLEHYEWLEKPSVSLGGFSLPLGNLANTIIDKSKAELERQINNSVSDQLTIKDKVMDLMKYVENPIQVDTLLNSWVQVIPEKVYMSEIRNEQNWTTGNVTIQGRTKVTSFKPKSIPGLTLPDFGWEESLDDTSHINVVLDLGYQQLEKYLNENYKGQTFSNDGKKVTINSINLSAEGNKLVGVADVSGSFNGKLKLSGNPVFDNEKQVFYAEDVDVSVTTKNILHKAGSWLLKGKIKKQLSEMMYFKIDDSINLIQGQIDAQLQNYQVKDQLNLIADLNRLKIEKFVLGSDRIHAFTTINIYLESQILDMRLFNDNVGSTLLRKP